MPTIDRVDGFAIRIYPNDHDPAHVHVVRAGAIAVIHIGSPATVREVHGNMKNADVRRAIEIVEANWERYLAEWRRMHG